MIDPYRFGIPNSAAALDAYTTNLWFAGGIRRLLASYPQGSPLIRVRRSSDNAEMDVLANGPTDPTLNTGSITSWSGADSVFVTTVYSQLNDGNNFLQATAGLQPRLYNAGVYDGFLRFDGTDDVLVSANLTPSCAGVSAALCAAQRAASDGAWVAMTNNFTAARKAMVWVRQAAVDRDITYVSASASAYDTWITNTYSPGAATMAGRAVALGLNLAGTWLHSINNSANSLSLSFATGGGAGGGNYTTENVRWAGAASELSSKALAFWTATLSAGDTNAVSNAMNF